MVVVMVGEANGSVDDNTPLAIKQSLQRRLFTSDHPNQYLRIDNI